MKHPNGDLLPFITCDFIFFFSRTYKYWLYHCVDIDVIAMEEGPKSILYLLHCSNTLQDHDQMSDLKFYSNSLIQKTKRNVEKGKGHRCNICRKVFKTNFKFRRHLMKHNVKQTFKCEHCSKQFTNNYRFTRHMNVHL